MDEKEKESIKVVDRRLFTPDGERRRDVPSERGESGPDQNKPAGAGSSEAAARENAGDGRARTGEGAKHEPAGEPVEERPTAFSEFVLSLAQNAFISLGQIPNPITHRAEADPNAAGAMIDLIELLRDKTTGNLTPYEKKVLDETLYQLKLLFIRIQQPKS
ncbi:MAG: DUF1844 domain-containing protein [Acidobacteriota bacterium]